MNKKKLSLIWNKYELSFFLLFVLLTTFAVGLLNFDKRAPIFYPDSYTYINFAESVKNHVFPDLSFRTPGYPLYLLLYGMNLKAAVLGQIFIGSLTSVCVFLIAKKLTLGNISAIIIAILLSFDGQVSCFQPILLTETLAVFALLLFCLLHISLFSDDVPKKSRVISCLISGILLFLIKPTFLFLPMAIYFAIFVLRVIQKRLTSQALRTLVFCFVINCIVIVIYSTINLINTGYWQFSNVTDKNLFAIIVNNGYLDSKYNYDNPPEIVKKVIEFNMSAPVKNDGYYIADPLQKISGENGAYNKNIQIVNKYIMDHQKWQYVDNAIHRIPMVFSWRREPYSDTANYFSWQIIANNYSNTFFKYANQYSLLICIISLLSAIYFLYKKEREKSSVLLLILCIVGYVIVTVSFLAPGEIARLKVPSTLFIDLIAIVIMFYFVRSFFRAGGCICRLHKQTQSPSAPPIVEQTQ